MATNGQSRTARRKQNKAAKKPTWKKVLLIIGIAVLAMGVGIGGLFTYYIATAPAIDASELESPYSSKIYDKDGELFADLADSEQRTKIEYDDLPQVLIDAVISTEDTRFFKHHGIDFYRIGGAIVANLKNGFGSEGASTITQQLAEQSFLSPEKKISIKVQEMWLALKLERQYSKEEILALYLNKIYYGNDAYGVARAAELYFGKTDLGELTLPEAAILAGLPQRPSGYNPFEHPDVMKDRMDTVLDRMVTNDAITKSEAEKAKNVDIPSLLTDETPEPTPYQAFLQEVAEEVEDKVDGADIYTDGLDIYTTIDRNAQDHVEFLLSDDADNPVDYPGSISDADGNEHKMQAGMTVLDTKSGAIRAIGGARGGVKNDGFNYATDIKRHPGSTFKPIMDYGPIIENEQWSTYHQLNDDGPYDIAGDNRQINTWANQYYGWVSMRYALQQSLNVPAAKTFNEVGTDNARKFAEDLGISVGDDGLELTDAIGGGNVGTNPLELAGAYSAFGNDGVYNEPYAVTKIEFPDSGRTVNLKPEPEAAMSESTAYMITDMLQTVIEEGTGTQANVAGLPDAGKTGTTTREGVDGSPDSWFNGYSTNYTISVWTGYDDNNIALPNTKVSQSLYNNAMAELSQNVDTPDFTKPDSVVKVPIEKGSNPAKKPSDNTPSSKIVNELFVKGTEPAKTSEHFEDLSLDPVSDLEANYDEDDNVIQVEWDYDSDEDNDIFFDVSAQIDDGDMHDLSSTEDKSMEISDVKPDAAVYTVQVIANDGDGHTGEPASVTVNISGDDEEDSDEENDDIPEVNNLEANESDSNIDVSWDYDGPPAQFEVSVSRDGSQLQTQTAKTEGMIIEGVESGNYTITVTPVGEINNHKGEVNSTEIEIEGNTSDQSDNQSDETQQDNNNQTNSDPTEDNADQINEQDDEEQENDDNDNED